MISIISSDCINNFSIAFQNSELEHPSGNTLAGKTYTPLLPYMAHLKASGAFKVVCDSYVTSDSGTGIVHQAPAFGEDDYRVGLANGIFKKGQEPQVGARKGSNLKARNINYFR